MKMRLIATDLDGTLLNEKHEISKENADAIQKAKDAGVEIMVATGRSYNAAKKPLDKVGLTCPIICLNGAKIYNKEGQIISTAPLEINSCKSIQHTCQKEGMYFELFTNKGGFSESRDKFLEVMVDIAATANPDIDEETIRSRASERFQEEEIKITNDFEALFNQPDIEVYKILAFSLQEQQLSNVYHQLKTNGQLAITSSGESNLEFNHPDAQKGIALEGFAKQAGIDMKDVMAIGGDNYNDVSMLKMAGRGVAMGNANDEIKKLADFTTTSNLDNGVAHAIEEMLSEIQKGK